MISRFPRTIRQAWHAARLRGRPDPPFALDRDVRKHFPTDVLANAGALGPGATCTRYYVGGSGLGRLHAVRIFEALDEACPTISVYVPTQNMCVWMIDRFGTDAQRADWWPRLAP